MMSQRVQQWEDIVDTFLIEYYITIKSNALETMKQRGKFVYNIKLKK